MKDDFSIRPLKEGDIPNVTQWSRLEGFAPGSGDVNIYRHTDNQGLWIGCLNRKPIGCIAGVRYNNSYGFIGLFLVLREYRGNGYGLKLWKQAFQHLIDVPCIGLEAALDRVSDYSTWGFKSSSTTTRWQLDGEDDFLLKNDDSFLQLGGLRIVEGKAIPKNVVQEYDANREPSPRPHFLSDWLDHPAGNVIALLDNSGYCHGFGRIRPCLLQKGKGWRIGPLIADSPALAQILIRKLVNKHLGLVLIDVPGLNSNAEKLISNLGFKTVSKTLRMYRGNQPPISMSDVYGLACLELG